MASPSASWYWTIAPGCARARGGQRCACAFLLTRAARLLGRARLAASTWQPNILWVLQSVISLQKPNLRPSIIVRVVGSKRITLVTMSRVSRAFSSVRSVWAYSGYVKLAVVFYPFLDGHRRTAHGIGSRYESLLYCRRNEHHPSSNVVGAEDNSAGMTREQAAIF